MMKKIFGGKTKSKRANLSRTGKDISSDKLLYDFLSGLRNNRNVSIRLDHPSCGKLELYFDGGEPEFLKIEEEKAETPKPRPMPEVGKIPEYGEGFEQSMIGSEDDVGNRK